MSNLRPNVEQIESTKWKPGESGNPNGQPKGSLNVKTIVKQLLESDLDLLVARGLSIDTSRYGNSKSLAECLAKAWLIKALDDSRFAKIIMELLRDEAAINPFGLGDFSNFNASDYIKKK